MGLIDLFMGLMTLDHSLNFVNMRTLCRIGIYFLILLGSWYFVPAMPPQEGLSSTIPSERTTKQILV
jgi:hypothetical protein